MLHEPATRRVSIHLQHGRASGGSPKEHERQISLLAVAHTRQSLICLTFRHYLRLSKRRTNI